LNTATLASPKARATQCTLRVAHAVHLVFAARQELLVHDRGAEDTPDVGGAQ
jgi:hypothetical protein